MKPHQAIFEKVKELLNEHFKDVLEEYEEGTHLLIGDTGIWIASDDRELTVGYGIVHQHYNPEYDDLNKAVEQFFNLLTKRRRITVFLKGSFSYKHRIELELGNSEYESLGTGMTWLFPYWKRTTKRITFEEPLIEASKVEEEIKNIKNLVQQQI